MKEIVFTAEAIASLICGGLAMILSAAAAVFFWHKKGGLKLKPLIVGAVVFPLFALILKAIPLYPLMIADNAVSRAINGSTLLTCAAAGLSAGIFEETGRFIAYKTLLRDCTDRRDAVSYGLGHGGFECLYIAVSAMIAMAFMGLVINSQGIEAVAKGAEGEMLDRVLTQLGAYSKETFGIAALAVCERISALVLQISMSVVVFAAARDKRKIWLYPLAVLLHSCIDFSLVPYASGKVGMIGMELMIAAYSAVTAVCVYFLLYRKMKGA